MLLQECLIRICIVFGPLHPHWAGNAPCFFQVSPVLGITAGTLILVFVPEPKRGSADQVRGRIKSRTSWICDMKALAKKYGLPSLSFREHVFVYKSTFPQPTFSLEDVKCFCYCCWGFFLA